jgi:hypothetical protein
MAFCWNFNSKRLRTRSLSTVFFVESGTFWEYILLSKVVVVPKLEFRISGLAKEQLDNSRDQANSDQTRLARSISKRGPLTRIPWYFRGATIWIGIMVAAVYVSQVGGSAPIGTPVSGPVAAHPNIFQPNLTGRRTGGGPNCDCGSVEFGLLTAEFRAECLRSEAQLKQLAAQGKLGLKVENGKLVAGQFCTNGGDRAWPVQNGPATPPLGVPEGQPCKPSGMGRSC